MASCLHSCTYREENRTEGERICEARCLWYPSWRLLPSVFPWEQNLRVDRMTMRNRYHSADRLLWRQWQQRGGTSLSLCTQWLPQRYRSQWLWLRGEIGITRLLKRGMTRNTQSVVWRRIANGEASVLHVRLFKRRNKKGCYVIHHTVLDFGYCVVWCVIHGVSESFSCSYQSGWQEWETKKNGRCEHGNEQWGEKLMMGEETRVVHHCLRETWFGFLSACSFRMQSIGTIWRRMGWSPRQIRSSLIWSVLFESSCVKEEYPWKRKMTWWSFSTVIYCIHLLFHSQF